MLAQFENRNNPIQIIHLVAAFLCPSFKNVKRHLGLADEKVESVHDFVKEKMKEISEETSPDDNQAVQIEQSEAKVEAPAVDVLLEEKQSEHLSSDDCGDSGEDIEIGADQEQQDQVLREFDAYVS